VRHYDVGLVSLLLEVKQYAEHSLAMEDSILIAAQIVVRFRSHRSVRLVSDQLYIWHAWGCVPADGQNIPFGGAGQSTGNMNKLPRKILVYEKDTPGSAWRVHVLPSDPLVHMLIQLGRLALQVDSDTHVRTLSRLQQLLFFALLGAISLRLALQAAYVSGGTC